MSLFTSLYSLAYKMRLPPPHPGQATAQPNTKGRQHDDTHSLPHNCIKSYNLINLYIPLPSSDSLGTIEIFPLCEL
ncbi:MAG: hypothetical protein EWV40_01590 [Microcystis flos-aquae Mf_WU_F_19750830_S460]|uniref:Uncharacterized protein n=1 Tax=Microcystis flos-aquae Mf_WU_F_19750830_S460 TaxID=2486237 RepID=A0A552M3R5_9CHRO|nr:MAG: hypothetical protein EWV40_01590 [Microcystis flos-aquae Mf_WU_F_19750830_S460]